MIGILLMTEVMENDSFSQILKHIIKGHSNAEIESTTGAPRSVIYKLRQMYNSFQYKGGRFNELEESIYLGKSNQEILKETSYAESEIKRARKKLFIRSPKTDVIYDAEELEKLVLAGLANKEIRLQIKCTDHVIYKIRKRLQKPSPHLSKQEKFDYKEHHPDAPRIKPDKSLDDMIAFGFTVDEISNEYNYGREIVLQRYNEQFSINN